MKQEMIFGPCREASYTAITLNPESNFTRPFPIPLEYIDVSRTTQTNLDVKQEKRIDDYWNIDGSRNLSDPWTGFTQFTLLEEKAPDGYTWSGGRLTRKQLTSRPDHLWPELWKSMGKNAKLKEKQKWSHEKTHLDNARKLRGIYFTDPEDKEFKETIKNARKKLETPMAPAVPCKIMKKNCGSGGPNKLKTRLACILEADEFTRLRMGDSLPTHHEDHIAGKGENSLHHYNSIESSSSASYSKWDDNHAWSSQEWKTDTEMCERSGRPDVTSWGTTRESQPGFSHEETHHDGTAQSVVNEIVPRGKSVRPDVDPQREARPQQFVIGNDETELELSVESRPFVNRVNDQVRKRQKRSSMNVTEDGEKHSIIWGMFMSLTMESAVFMGKNYLDKCHSITNTKDLTLKQVFDISTKLVSEQDEISGLETIGWEKHAWKNLSLISDERIINLQRTKVYVFSDSVLCLGKI